MSRQSLGVGLAPLLHGFVVKLVVVNTGQLKYESVVVIGFVTHGIATSFLGQLSERVRERLNNDTETPETLHFLLVCCRHVLEDILNLSQELGVIRLDRKSDGLETAVSL
jgi:hypothetical protein